MFGDDHIPHRIEFHFREYLAQGACGGAASPVFQGPCRCGLEQGFFQPDDRHGIEAAAATGAAVGGFRIEEGRGLVTAAEHPYPVWIAVIRHRCPQIFFEAFQEGRRENDVSFAAGRRPLVTDGYMTHLRAVELMREMVLDDPQAFHAYIAHEQTKQCDKGEHPA